MKTIEGHDVKIFTDNIEDCALEQIKELLSIDVFADRKIRIMPDVHSGKGCTIGTTMTIIDKAVPNIVGVDIGCGMYTVKLGNAEIDFAKLDEAAHYVPSGMHVWEGRQERFDLQSLRCYRSLKNTKWLERSLGTLGRRKSFLQKVEEASDKNEISCNSFWQPNLGKQVAELYQQLAVDLNKGKETYFQEREEIIRSYKEQGRRKEIQEALAAISWQKREATIPEDLCFLYGTYLDDYLHDVEICQAFARCNREKIAEVLLARTGLAGGESFHTIHNYIDTNEMILRKVQLRTQGREGIDSN